MEGSMSDVFISYSRKDIAFAHILHDALKAKNLNTWIDWQDIPPSADWLAEVYRAIEGADTFVFILSQTSISSDICRLEIAHAPKHHKRMVPIVLRDIDARTAPPEVASLNWIFFREQEDFQQAFDKLLQAVQTDLKWVRMHTRLLVRAIEWDGKKRNASYLLRGDDLRAAEEWQAQAVGKEPKPTPLQLQYNLASRRSATTRQRITLGAVTFGLTIAIVLAFAALLQRNDAVFKFAAANTAEAKAVTEAAVRATAEANAIMQANARATAQARAEEQHQIAVGRQLAAQSQISLDNTGTGLVRSVLLAVESLRRYPALEGDQAIRLGLHLLPRPVARMTHDNSVWSMVISPNGQWVATASWDHTARVWDIATGREIARVMHAEDVQSVAFSPDGRWVASGEVCGGSVGHCGS